MPPFVAPRQLETLEIFKFGLCRAAMITTAQIRAGRGLLKWTQAALAHRAAISAVTLTHDRERGCAASPGYFGSYQASPGASGRADA